ncbi:formamidopyrimidine-DNA glycosylase [Betaproteobacteria bacterium GR16-43]|nr:formamidopyrimidine-DNA glycosylase [Betaproteobacteria bacterium GR16-43]
MPELPDVQVYLEALDRRVVGQRLERIKLSSPFVLRSVDPPPDAVFGKTVLGVRRIGKRIVLAFDGAFFLVLHLMIAGRLRWRDPGGKPGVGAKIVLATFEFPSGFLLFTEAGSKKRASLTVVRGEDALKALDPGGIEPLEASTAQFQAALARENHTLKRALTDPRLFSGIGNAYSDEILHAAKLSPMKLTKSLNEEESGRLHQATRETLTRWTQWLRDETGDGFPEKVTAFHDRMAVHGRYKLPCPVCGSPVQRIVYAENEANYCARCQTGGRLLADRSLSRLLKDDWPKSIDDL